MRTGFAYVQSNSRCAVYVLCNEAGVSLSTWSLVLARSTRRGRKGGGGWVGARGWKRNQGTGTCLNRHATLVFALSPALSVSVRPFTTCTLSLLPSLVPRARFQHSLPIPSVFRSFCFFVLLLCIILQWRHRCRRRFHRVAWPLVLGRGLKCHSFSSCARFRAPKESSVPFSFVLSLHFSTPPPLLHFATVFRSPSNTCPVTERRETGERGERTERRTRLREKQREDLRFCRRWWHGNGRSTRFLRSATWSTRFWVEILWKEDATKQERRSFDDRRMWFVDRGILCVYEEFAHAKINRVRVKKSAEQENISDVE